MGSKDNEDLILNNFCDEAKSVFNERYAAELGSHRFAKNDSLWSPDAGLYLLKYGKKCTLIVDGNNTRASDEALKSTWVHMLAYIPNGHRLMIASASVVRQYEKTLKKWYHFMFFDPLDYPHCFSVSGLK